MSDLWTRIVGGRARVLIGMVHLRPLPGSPRYGGGWPAVCDAAEADAKALLDGGVDGLMIENFGDAPFYPGRTPVEVASHMSAIAGRIRAMTDKPIGVNVLRNDGCAAMAVAHAAGAQFIRVNVLCGARLTDQGIVQGIAHDLLRLRRTLGAGEVAILADVNVKHSAALAEIALEQPVRDLLDRGGADGLIVTGAGTGRATALGELLAVRDAASQAPVLIGSGVTADNIGAYVSHAAGFIVGTWLKRGGVAGEPVDAQRVRDLADALRPSRKQV